MVDNSTLNPELGSESDFHDLVQETKKLGMGLVLDIVPNHLAADLNNEWWQDVLKKGSRSRYAAYFDIDGEPVFEDLRNTLLLPVLGEPYATALKHGALSILLRPEGFFIGYHGLRFPINLAGCRIILRGLVPDTKVAAVLEHRHRARMTPEMRLWRTLQKDSSFRSRLEQRLARINKSGPGGSSRLLDLIIDAQHYRLAYWRTGTEKINYRRFFNITDLIGIKVENKAVFEDTHRFLRRLVKAGKVTGLRVDHIDGLYDPANYLQRMRDYLMKDGGRLYVVVEKILLQNERLPRGWPVCGTTGYEFCRALNGLFIHPEGLVELARIYGDFTGLAFEFDEVVHAKKREVMQKHFAAEMRTLSNRLWRIAFQDKEGRDLSLAELRRAFEELTACLTVYRTYINASGIAPRDRQYLRETLLAARRRMPPASGPLFEFLSRLFLMRSAPEQREHWLRFLMSWQQFTGSVMAKGLEDTALYVYNRLISMNEVGGDPAGRHIGPTAFHVANVQTLRNCPHTLNATSTHDVKRGEDVRARINVLSEIPGEWELKLRNWRSMNARKKLNVSGKPVPHFNEEYFFYQTLLGAWPADAQEALEFKRHFVRGIALNSPRVFTAVTT